MKKILLPIFILSFLFLFSCSKGDKTEVMDTKVTPKYVNTQIVWEKKFSENIKLAWKVSSSLETPVSPLASGLIKEVKVKVWDEVKSWDILAVIDTESNLTNISLNNAQNVYDNTLTVFSTTKESLEKNLENAHLQLENAKIAKENAYNSTKKQLELAEASLNSVLKQKENTTKITSSSLDLAQESLTNANLNLENFNKNYTETLKNLDSKKNTIIDNIKVSIDSSLVTFDSSLIAIDTILWVTNANKSLNDSYEIYIWAKSTWTKDTTERLFSEANSIFIKLKSVNTQNYTQDELIKYYSEIISLSEKMVVLFEKMVSVLENTITSSSLPDVTLAWFKTSIKAYQQQIISTKSALIWLRNALTDIENTISSTKTSLDTQKLSIEQSIRIAQANLNNTIASTNTNLDSISSSESTTKIQLENTISSIKSTRETADNALKIAENQYNAAKANYEAQLASIKSQLDSATGQKKSLNQQYENALIKAPFDWVIVSKNIEVWTMVSQWVQAFVISNPLNKIVKLDVNSDNIKYLQIWKEVKLEKSGQSFTWVISVLWASADNNTKMFKVEVSLLSSEIINSLVLWDFVDVFIEKELWEQKYIVVPFSSIIVWSNNTYSIYVVSEKNLVEEKKVQVWTSNSSEVIINKWLKIWDKIIVWGALNVSVWDLVEEIK